MKSNQIMEMNSKNKTWNRKFRIWRKWTKLCRWNWRFKSYDADEERLQIMINCAKDQNIHNYESLSLEKSNISINYWALDRKNFFCIRFYEIEENLSKSEYKWLKLSGKGRIK